MRMLWLLGCVVSASTAYAQPGATADAPPVPPAGAPPTAAPVPMPGAPPGLTPPCAPTTVCVPQDALGPATTPALALQAEPEGSYRWQVFAADGASLALLVSGSKTGATVGAVGYLLAAPIVHMGHDEGGRAAASLALRVGLPIAGAFGLAAALKHPCSADDDDCDDGTLEGAILGFGLGMLAAMVIDTALIARPVKAKPAVTWVPQVAVTPQQVGLSVVGRF